MAYDINSYKTPFWAKSADFIRGRDPLGIQNSSISLYSRLLPGMTNLTLRLRYYGFMLWLLSEYELLDDKSDFKKSLRGQYNFLRRGELIMAYFMANQYPDEQSVIGVNFAIRNINQYEETGYYDIAKGADKLAGTVKNSVYWDYISGAFGQYYVGSFFSLGLVESISDGYFKTTNYGLELAEAFRNTVSQEERDLLLEAVLSGKLFFENIEKLDGFALNRNIADTDEKEFYHLMLLAKDGIDFTKISGEDTFQRKQSIKYFLIFLQNEEIENEYFNFPRFNYLKALKNGLSELSDAEIGWYYYYLNELVHYSLETVFWGMLQKMSTQTYTVKQFTEEITADVLNINSGKRNYFDGLLVSDILSDISTDLEFSTDVVDSIQKAVKGKESSEAISLALDLLMHLYKVNSSNVNTLADYAQQYDVLDKNGNALAFYKRFFNDGEDQRFADFVESILKSIINDHTFIAYRKMGNGEKNLLKFFIEDNYLIHIETMQPNFTSPRLRTLSNFMTDLGLVTEENKLNVEALNLLAEWN